MYSQYNGNFSQLVFFLGDSLLTSQILEKINDNEFFTFSDYNFKLVNELILPDKKEKSGGLHEEGLLNYDWIEKRVYIVPSLVLFALDWSIPLPNTDWREKEAILMNEFFKFKENLKSRNIRLILLIFLGKNTSYNLALDDKLANLKKNLEIEHSRFIFLLPGGLELIQPNKKKLQKAIEEISHSYYRDYLKKVKKKLSKLQDIASQERNLIKQLKAAIISEIMKKDKSLGYYTSAYENMKIIGKYYMDSANYSIKDNDFPGLVQNYESLLRNEELRYLADIITFRIIHINLAKGLFQECFSLFERHYRAYKGKVNYFESRLCFEEYKWRSEFFRNFAYIILREFFNIKKNLVEKGLMFRFLNIFHASVFFSDKRSSLMWAKNKDWSNFSNIGSLMKKVKPLYFGRSSYKLINEVNPLEKVDNTKKIIENSIYYRVFEEVNRNVPEENIEVLRKIEKFSIKEDSELITTKYLLAQNYLKNKDFDNFNLISCQFLKFLTLSHWKTLFLPILLSIEENLKINPQYPYEILSTQLDLMLYSEEKPEKNIENMLLLLQTSEKETFLKKTLHRNEIIKGRVGFESSFCHYFEEVSLIVEIEMKYEGLFGLFDHLSVNFNEKEYNKRIEVNEMRKEGNLLKKKVPLKLIRKITGEERLYIVSIELIGEKKSLSGKNLGLCLLLPVEALEIQRNNAVNLKPAINGIDVNLEYPKTVFLNEKFELMISLKKNENIKGNLNNLKVFFIDQDFDQSGLKKLPKIQDNCAIFKVNDENEVEYDNSSAITIPLITKTQDSMIKFTIIIKEEIEKKFFLMIDYNLDKTAEEEPISFYQRDLIKKLTIQVLNPFIMRTRVKILNHYCNNQYKNENLGGKNSVLSLPLNQKCNILYYLTPPTADCFIKSIQIIPFNSPYFTVLGNNLFTEEVFIKQNEAITGGFLIKTTGTCEETPLGTLSIEWKKSFEKNPIKLEIPFNSLSIEEKQFEIEIKIKDIVEYGEMTPLVVNFINKTGVLQNVLLNLIDMEGFLISGDIRRNFEAKHNENKVFLFNILAMGVGKKKLPGMLFICVSMENKVIWDSSGTRFITVIPKRN